MRFGYFLVPDAAAPLLAAAVEAERRGLDYVAVQDPPTSGGSWTRSC